MYSNVKLVLNALMGKQVLLSKIVVDVVSGQPVPDKVSGVLDGEGEHWNITDKNGDCHILVIDEFTHVLLDITEMPVIYIMGGFCVDTPTLQDGISFSRPPQSVLPEHVAWYVACMSQGAPPTAQQAHIEYGLKYSAHKRTLVFAQTYLDQLGFKAVDHEERAG